MCTFYWCFCFCCNKYKKTVADSKWCGNVDCSRNIIHTSYCTKMCSICINSGCYKRKVFCDSNILPDVISTSKKNLTWIL